AILVRLDKGHTTADASAAIALLREHGIEPRPSFMPFTPWTTPQDVVDLLDFVVEHDLIANVDPVQYMIRLLIPEGSLLLGHPDPVRSAGGDVASVVGRVGAVGPTRSMFRSYSAGNCMLLALQCRERGLDPVHIAGFRTSLKLGRCIRSWASPPKPLHPIRVR